MDGLDDDVSFSFGGHILFLFGIDLKRFFFETWVANFPILGTKGVAMTRGAWPQKRGF